MKKLFAFLSIALLAVVSVSCDREEPINPEEEVIVKEDPYKDWPKLTAFSEEETRVSYDGLVTGDDSKRIFDSHFDAGDKIYLVVNGTEGVHEYEYEYVAKGQPWRAVGLDDGAPYDPSFEYYAYWNGQNVSLFSFLSHTYTMIGEDRLISFFARALRDWSNNVIDIKKQGTLAKFKAQDILTGLGEVRGENSVKFTLYHAMGLACIKKITGGAQTVKSIKTLRNDEFYKWVEETTTDKIIGTSESAPHGCWPYDMGTGTDEKYQYWYLWIPPRELEGKAIISSDHKWSREFRVGTRKFARFSLTQSNVNEYYDIRFGDIFYSDGSLSHNGYIYTNSTTGRKPIGMVVNTNESSVNDATIAAIKRSQASFPGPVSDENNRGKNGNGTGFHALVIALENATYNNSEKIVWSQVRSGYRYEPSNVTVNSSEFCNTYNSLYADNAGYTKTNVVKAKTNYQNLFPAFSAAVNYNVALSRSDITSTEWFLPSAGQWLKIFDYLRGDSNPECYLVDYNDPPTTLDEWNSWIESGKAVRLDVNSGAIAPKWALVDMLDEFYMDQYLKNAGSQSSINAPGVIFRSSTECTASVSANFCVGGSTIKELTISNNKEKKSSNQEYVRAFLAF